MFFTLEIWVHSFAYLFTYFAHLFISNVIGWKLSLPVIDSYFCRQTSSFKAALKIKFKKFKKLKFKNLIGNQVCKKNNTLRVAVLILSHPFICVTNSLAMFLMN